MHVLPFKESFRIKTGYLLSIMCYVLASFNADINSQSLGFNQDRGFYKNSISLTLTSDLTNSTIKYTTDSSLFDILLGLESIQVL